MLGGRPHRLFKYNDKNDVMPDLFYRNTKEMLEDFSFIDNEKLINEIVIENTYKFANEIEDVKIFKKGLFAPK
jgi:DNA polymerase-3 subunit alpha (Gram-positive type)